MIEGVGMKVRTGVADVAGTLGVNKEKRRTLKCAETTAPIAES
jgi:hypothetical protein